MQSKISLFNREVIIQVFRSVGWISVIQLLLLLFALPLEILMRVSDEQTILRKVDNLFQYHFEIQLITLIGVPVLLAVFLFRYLHVKDAAHFIHSLPIKRERLFHQYTWTGIFLLILPIVLTAVLNVVLLFSFHLTAYFSIQDIFYWAGVTILLELTLFMAGIFVAMFTGLSAVHAVLSYIFLLFPAGIFILVIYNLKFLFFGFPYDYFLNKEIERISPVLYAGVMDHQILSKTYMSIFFVVIVLLYFLSLYVYKKRKVEAVSHAIAFEKLKSTFKYGTAFCTMLLGGMYFGEVQGQMGWTVFGYAAGSVIGFFAAEMVLRKTWRVFGQFKGYVVFAGVITVVILLSQLALSHYEAKIPTSSDVEKVHFSDNSMIYLGKYPISLPYSVQEKNNIEAVRTLHNQIIDRKQSKTTLVNGWEQVLFAYELKNGKKVIRQYRINKNDYEFALTKIYESKEYKRSSNELFQVKDQDVTRISINAHSSVNKRVTFSDEKEIAELLKHLKEDVLEESYENIKNPRGNLATIEILLTNKRSIVLETKSSFERFENWLENKGLLNQVKMTADDIDYVIVAKKEAVIKDSNMEVSPDLLIKQLEENGKVIKITDKNQINQSLMNSSSDYSKGYLAGFYLKNVNYPEFRGIDENYLPDFIKEQMD